MKVSRPVVYTLAAAVVGYGTLTLLTPQDEVTTKHKSRTTQSGQNKSDSYTDADYKAHFARYTPQNRNAFLPRIVPSHSAAAGQAGKAQPGKLGQAGTWTLTGISKLDGLRNALVENTATHESVELSLGQTWNGLRVIAIRDDAVDFVDAKGKRSSISFEVQVAVPGGRAAPGGPGGVQAPGAVNAAARSQR
jgi:hypothetical protein